MVEHVSHEPVGHAVDAAEGQRHAVVERLQGEKLVTVLADQVGDPSQQPDALAGPAARPRPFVEGGARRRHGAVHVLRAGDRERRDVLAGRGMTVRPGLLVS
jgi:hypothetical protein